MHTHNLSLSLSHTNTHVYTHMHDCRIFEVATCAHAICLLLFLSLSHTHVYSHMHDFSTPSVNDGYVNVGVKKNPSYIYIYIRLSHTQAYLSCICIQTHTLVDKHTYHVYVCIYIYCIYIHTLIHTRTCMILAPHLLMMDM